MSNATAGAIILSAALEGRILECVEEPLALTEPVLVGVAVVESSVCFSWVVSDDVSLVPVPVWLSSKEAESIDGFCSEVWVGSCKEIPMELPPVVVAEVPFEATVELINDLIVELATDAIDAIVEFIIDIIVELCLEIVVEFNIGALELMDGRAVILELPKPEEMAVLLNIPPVELASKDLLKLDDIMVDLLKPLEILL